MNWLEKVRILRDDLAARLKGDHLSDSAREAFVGMRIALEFALAEFEKDRATARRYGR